MKRAAQLMERIAFPDNLREAFLRAAKGKSQKKAVREFRDKLNDNLCLMRTQILSGQIPMTPYRYFRINDPKERVICAAPFNMRVLFHAVMRICHPIFDNYQISDSYASRKQMGQYKAIDRARQFARQFRWFAKLDVRKYFDSINHAVLLQQLRRLIKDKMLLRFFRQLIDGYHTAPGKGLPIGNLTSQYFANHYLALADHQAKNQIRIKAYVRYMDDILIFANDKEQLMNYVNSITEFISDNLLLKMHEPVINHTSRGVPFLGYVIYPDVLRLSQRSRKRYKRKVGILNKLHADGIISRQKCAERLQCLNAFIEHADTMRFKSRLNEVKGLYPCLIDST